MQESSKISSLVCVEADGSTIVAAGYENGKLGYWGGIDKEKHSYTLFSMCTYTSFDPTEKFEKESESDVIQKVFITQVFLGDSFYRESLLSDYYEFTADFNGGKFENYPSYSLEIPRGAIPEGEEVVITTGILKYGPCDQFECPDNIDIVSPVVWLCSNKRNFQFLKPVVLEMQHCCSTPESLVLMKADHDSTMGIHEVFNFQVQTPSSKYSSGKYYHSAEITHFCLYCYGIYSRDDGVQRGFRLIPVERIGYMDKTHQVTFCLTYNLDCCQKVTFWYGLFATAIKCIYHNAGC